MTDFPAGFFDRTGTAPDSAFYREPRFVQHIDSLAFVDRSLPNTDPLLIVTGETASV